MTNGALVPSSCKVPFCFDIFSDIVILLFFCRKWTSWTDASIWNLQLYEWFTVIAKTAKNDIKWESYMNGGTWVNILSSKKRRLHKWIHPDFHYCQCSNIHMYMYVESIKCCMCAFQWLLVYFVVNAVFLSFKSVRSVYLMFVT